LSAPAKARTPSFGMPFRAPKASTSAATLSARSTAWVVSALGVNLSRKERKPIFSPALLAITAAATALSAVSTDW
jgi:hypothetical protein